MSFTSHTGKDYEAVTSGNLTPHADAIYIGGDGDLICTPTVGGSAVTFVGVVAGTILPIAISNIGGGSTATNLVAIYDRDKT